MDVLACVTFVFAFVDASITGVQKHESERGH